MSKSTERVYSFRERQLKLKRKKREFYLTDSEHKLFKKKLKEMRNVSDKD